MDFGHHNFESRLRAAWEAVSIERSIPYTLFTFGISDLPYYLIVEPQQRGDLVAVSRGEVKVNRPLLITPDNAVPELQNFFDDGEFGEMASFLLSRSAAFSHLRLENHSNSADHVSDSSQEVVSRLNRKLDAEGEDRVAILRAPFGLGGVAVMRYTTERILESAPGNIRELREKGFLPEF